MAEKRPNRVSGPVHDEFWAWCAKGELHLQRCAACGKLTCPPSPACSHCGSAELTWERMSGRGRLVSWCSFERDYYRGQFPLPWLTILVELEEGPLFLSNPLGLEEQDLRLSMPLTLDFLDCEDAAGLFRLPVFRKG